MKNTVSLALLIISAILSFKHSWDTFNYKNNGQSLQMMNDLGIGGTVIPAMVVLNILIGLLILFPRTFFLANVINAMSIVLIISLALKAGHTKMALIEVPFLLIPLILTWLKYPFKN